MCSDVGSLARERVVEVWGQGSSIHTDTSLSQLKVAQLGREVQSGSSSIDWLTPDAVCFLAAKKSVVVIVVDVHCVVAKAVISRRAHVEDVVPRDGVSDDAVAAEPASRQPIIGPKKRVVKNIHVTGHPVVAVGKAHFEEIAAAGVRL